MKKPIKYSQYKFKFYLNANHSIYIDGVYGKRHPHTWEISIHILKMRDEFIMFNFIEGQIEAFLQKYQDKFINDIAPFNTINPTLENICIYFKDELSILLNRQGWILMLIEISETPTRSYVINLFNEDRDTNYSDGDLQQEMYVNYYKQEKLAVEEISDRIIEDILNDK